MKCPYLCEEERRDPGAECRATERYFEPSRFELEQYCTTNLHRRCPLYDQIKVDSKVLQPFDSIIREVKRAVG